jgi:hypothetical protein
MLATHTVRCHKNLILALVGLVKPLNYWKIKLKRFIEEDYNMMGDVMFVY